MANSKSTSCKGSNHVIINPYIYLSCIKIHGNRILPPLLSPEKREEMQFYKTMALQVEENMKLKETIAIREKFLNSSTTTYNSDDCATFSDDNQSQNFSPDKDSSSSSEELTLKSQIFSESCRSDVLKMLHDRNPLKSMLSTPSCENTAISKVPLSENSSKEKLNTECDFSEQISSTPLNNHQKQQDSLKFKSFTLPSIRKDSCNVNDSNLVFNQTVPQKFANADDGVSKVEKTNSFYSKADSSYKDRTSSSPITHKSKAVGDSLENLNSSSEISPQESGERTPSPKLIRSNSYVLDKPSPYLLAMMQQQESFGLTPENSGRKRRTWDLKSAQQKWSSIENDLNSTSELIRSPKRRSENTFSSLPNSSSPSPEPAQSCKSSKKIIKPPEKETRIVRTTIQPLPISSSSPKKRKIETKDLMFKKCPQKTELLRQRRTSLPDKVPALPKRPEIVGEKSQLEIRDIIDKIQEHQSTEMTNLIEKQRKEQERLMRVFAEQQAMLLTKLKCVNTYRTKNKKDTSEMLNYCSSNNNTIDNDESSTELNLKQSENLLLECKKLLDETSAISMCDSGRTSNQTLYCTAFSSPEENSSFRSGQKNTDDDTTLNSDLMGARCGPRCRRTPEKSFSSPDKYSRSFSIDSLERNASISAKEMFVLRSSSCNRQLFPSRKQILAANTINAYTRGFLVRRLLKTDRLKDLRVLMRESVMCSMSYLLENPDNIKQADQDLHKGLVQQISGNLKSIHNIFFELSKSEQMKIITIDRNIKKARALRPVSARSSSSLSSTTQRVLERKLRRRCSDSTSVTQSKTSSSKSGNPSAEFRNRARSLGHPDAVPVNNRKSYPQNDLIHGSMGYGANKKPWR